MRALGHQVSSVVVHTTVERATTNDVCAIVVTYNPDSDFPSRLAALQRQVAEVIVVDNSSSTITLNALRRPPAEQGISLIQNHENRGVATALNQGLSLAREHGFNWALLLDQDTIPGADIADRLLEACRDFPDPNMLAIIGANYFHGTTGRLRWPQDLFSAPSWMERKVVITSGSLVSLNAYQVIGPFRDEYFIDCVDLEYCLRARAKGFKVIVTRRPLMTHDIGQPTFHRLLGRRVGTTNHSALRRYYLVRNHIALAKEYVAAEPLWILASLGRVFRSTLTCALFERDRLLKAKYTALGLLDGLRSNFDRTLF